MLCNHRSIFAVMKKIFKYKIVAMLYAKYFNYKQNKEIIRTCFKFCGQ